MCRHEDRIDNWQKVLLLSLEIEKEPLLLHVLIISEQWQHHVSNYHCNRLSPEAMYTSILPYFFTFFLLPSFQLPCVIRCFLNAAKQHLSHKGKDSNLVTMRILTSLKAMTFPQKIKRFKIALMPLHRGYVFISL